MTYKTLRCILTPDYDLRKQGVHKLYSAMNHLGWLRWDGHSFDGGENKPAVELLREVLHKNGNFYINHERFPLWRKNLESRWTAIQSYFHILWAALRNSDDIGWLD